MAASSRDIILARIRQGLAQPAPLPPRPDFVAPVHPPLNNPDVVVAFAESFQRVGGEFYYCESLEHLAVQLAGFQHRQKVGAPYVWEPKMQALLHTASVAFRATEADFIAEADLGLTSCEALVAQALVDCIDGTHAQAREPGRVRGRQIQRKEPQQVAEFDLRNFAALIITVTRLHNKKLHPLF